MSRGGASLTGRRLICIGVLRGVVITQTVVVVVIVVGAIVVVVIIAVAADGIVVVGAAVVVVLGVLKDGEGLRGRRRNVVTVGVDRFTVSAKVHFPLESFLTETAGEGLVAGVLPHVGDEVGGLTERLPAHYALVGLLTCN